MRSESAKTAFATAAMLAGVVLCALACRFFGGSGSADEAGIVMQLPEIVYPWKGTTFWFCQNPECRKAFLSNECTFGTPCPECGGELLQMNIPERTILPADTEIVRRYYDTPQHFLPLNVSIVLSGADRSSIHRPEVCQTAAGHEIVQRRRIRVPLSWRPEKPLEVTVLEMTRHGGADGTPPQHSFYAYWFIGAKGRETASHWKRFWWMARDRVFGGISHRWAYIAVFGPRTPGEDGYLNLLSAFVSQLHRKVLRTPETEGAPEAESGN